MNLIEAMKSMDQEVLKKRANTLSSFVSEKESKDKVLMSLFQVGASSKFGVEARLVESISLNSNITPIPHSPEYIYGVTYFQGEIITVIDTSAFFDVEMSGDQFEYKIVLNNNGNKIAILASEILDLESLSKEELSFSDSLVDKEAADYTFGIYKGEVLMLNAARLIDNEHLILEVGSDR